MRAMTPQGLVLMYARYNPKHYFSGKLDQIGGPLVGPLVIRGPHPHNCKAIGLGRRTDSINMPLVISTSRILDAVIQNHAR